MPTKITAQGYLYALGAVSIWAGWMVFTRLGLQTSLNVADITALRFFTAGFLLLPVVMKKGLALDKLGKTGLLILVMGAGAPYALVSASGLLFAPASHAAALMPGTMPMFVALLSACFLAERFNRIRILGYALIVCGALVLITLQAGDTTSDGALIGYGQALFLCAAFMWACFTLVMRKAKLAALHATAIVAVCSMLFYVPTYLWFNGLNFIHAPTTDIVAQVVYQGILSSIVSLWLFAKGVTILGAAKGASMASLVPIIAAVMAIPVLNEWPATVDWLGITLVSIGVFLANSNITLPKINNRSVIKAPSPLGEQISENS